MRIGLRLQRAGCFQRPHDRAAFLPPQRIALRGLRRAGDRQPQRTLRDAEQRLLPSAPAVGHIELFFQQLHAVFQRRLFALGPRRQGRDETLQRPRFELIVR